MRSLFEMLTRQFSPELTTYGVFRTFVGSYAEDKGSFQQYTVVSVAVTAKVSTHRLLLLACGI